MSVSVRERTKQRKKKSIDFCSKPTKEHTLRASPYSNLTYPTPIIVHQTMSSVQTAHQQQQEPLDLIRFQLDEYVIVKLRGAREFKGKLQGYDSHCNLVLSDATETIFSEQDGVEPVVKRTEMVFVRGDSVILISPVIEK